VPAGEFVTRSIRMSTGSGNMYVVAVAPLKVPEQARTWTLLALSLGLVFWFHSVSRNAPTKVCQKVSSRRMGQRR
jgi:hypothetical protein